jgi:hypothetical protein
VAELLGPVRVERDQVAVRRPVEPGEYPDVVAAADLLGRRPDVPQRPRVLATEVVDAQLLDRDRC